MGVIIAGRGGIVMGVIAGSGGRSVGVRTGCDHAEHGQPADEHGSRHEQRSRQRRAGRALACWTRAERPCGGHGCSERQPRRHPVSGLDRFGRLQPVDERNARCLRDSPAGDEAGVQDRAGERDGASGSGERSSAPAQLQDGDDREHDDRLAVLGVCSGGGRVNGTGAERRHRSDDDAAAARWHLDAVPAGLRTIELHGHVVPR